MDTTVDRILARILESIHPTLHATGWNTDRPPFYHVQSVGHIAGVDEYVEPTSACDDVTLITRHRDEEMWGDLRSKILGVSLHPHFGGWYAYRMLLVLNNVSWPDSIDIKPITFLTPEERSTVITEFNSRPDIGHWRDFNNKEISVPRYDTVQFLFFHEKSTDKRRRILEFLKTEGYDKHIV